MFKTQCPHCSTQFKLSQQHLNQAGGMVRCGSCLKPFQAKDHLVEQPAVAITKVPSPARSSTPPVTPQAKPQVTPATSPSLTDELGSPEDLLADSKWQMPDEDLPESQSESLFDGSLSLGEEMELSEELDAPYADFSESLGVLDSALNKELDDNDAQLANSSADESWAEDLLKEVEQETQIAPPSAEAPPKNTPKESPKAETIVTPAVPVSLFDFDESDTGSFSQQRPIKEIPPAPKEPVNLWKWGGLSLLMLAILGIQYLVFNFQDLARQDTYRPFYQQACQVLPCELPELVDLNRMRVTNLYIRNLEDEPGTLLVDLILHNEASFEQPFPNLQLVFSNQQSELLAEGVFTSEQYLNGRLKELKALPAKSRTQLSFRISDPGEDAKDFVIHILVPDHA